MHPHPKIGAKKQNKNTGHKKYDREIWILKHVQISQMFVLQLTQEAAALELMYLLQYYSSYHTDLVM